MEKLKKKAIDTTVKDRENLFKLDKENRAFKGKILRDIRYAFRLENEHKAVKGIILRNIRNVVENE